MRKIALLFVSLVSPWILASAATAVVPVFWSASVGVGGRVALVSATKLSLLASDQIAEQHSSLGDYFYNGAGGNQSVSGAGTAGTGFAYGRGRGVVVSSGGILPDVYASSVATYTGKDYEEILDPFPDHVIWDGYIQADTGVGSIDRFVVASDSLAAGTPVTLHFAMLLRSHITERRAPFGGDLFYGKSQTGIMRSVASSLLSFTDTTSNAYGQLSISNSELDGIQCTPVNGCLYLYASLPEPVVGEECYANGCFVVPSTPVVAPIEGVLVRGTLDTQIGRTVQITLNGGASSFSEAKRFGTVSSDATARYGVEDTPAGVTIHSELGYDYAFDTGAVVALPAPEPAPTLAVPVAAFALWVQARRRR